jgi:hypothetical protein
MRLIETLLVRDEVDIIEAHLDFHLAQGVEHVIVTDNGSRDGTRDILADYERTGRIEVIDEPPSDFSQHRWVTRMAERAYAVYAADWVLHADADEFFLPGESSLGEAFAGVEPALNAVTMSRQDFVVVESGGEVPVHPRGMTCRKTRSLNSLGRILLPKVAHRGVASPVVSQGNHDVQFDGIQKVAWDGVMICHYPIRTWSQFQSKVRNGGTGYAANPELSARFGGHKQAWYRMLLAGTLETEFRSKVLSPEAFRKGLDSGELVEDRRVADKLAATGTARRRPIG